MKIAVQGLGKMGMQISRKLAEGGHTVYGMDLNASALQEATEFGITVVETKDKLVEAFNGEQVVIWIMLAAQIVDAQVDEWLSMLPAGSILVDGGNSDFRSTKALNDKVTSSGSMLIDVGTSGGIWGYDNGFSMMVGVDSAEAFAALEPGLKTLAAPEGAYHHFGASGSGHYVKMVHNGVEYGMMQSLAEGYRMLKEGPYAALDLAAAGEVWQHHSVITSWLNELTQSALRENPDLTGIDGVVVESGEARWTLEIAEQLGIELPSIRAAFDVRVASEKGQTNFATKLVAAMRNKFGGHALNG
jgi:6-phosphogluconate dehydrogenase